MLAFTSIGTRERYRNVVSYCLITTEMVGRDAS